MIEKKNMNLRKRLMYQCMHMGTKELDLLLGEFAKKKLKNLSIKQLKELDLILKYNDHSLFLYITKKMKPPNIIYNQTLKNIILFNKYLNIEI